MSRKISRSVKHSKRTTPTRKTRRPGKLAVTGWHIVYFVAVMLFLGALWVFLPNKTDESNRCANEISCINDLTGNYDDKNEGVFADKPVTGPALAGKPYLANNIAESTHRVLGATTADNKRIAVDLTTQHLYAYEGSTQVFDFLVSTGKWGRTPTGDFRIWIKLRYTRMQGGNKALGTYYNLPNVPYTMYFYNDQVPKSLGYGIHGAYWHNNFGHPMSHGCINMKEEDVAKLYAWANPSSTSNVTNATADNPGTLITIYGTAPQQ